MNGKISAAILAGGAATRFDGRVKSKIIIDGSDNHFKNNIGIRRYFR